MDFKTALVKIKNICAKNEKCKSDIRKKLYEYKINNLQIEEIIDILEKKNFINEKRYCKSFVNSKLNYNKWGIIKIKYHLKQKQIPDNIVECIINDINKNDYNYIIEQEIIKKNKSIKETDKYKLKNKLLRFAQSRGFEIDIAQNIIENII